MRIEGEYNDQLGHRFTAVRVDGQVLEPKRSQKLWNHSPDGFAWGYEGSGPAQLALAILLAGGWSDETAVHLHQAFKREFLAPLPQDHFVLDVDLDDWVARHQFVAPSRAKGDES